MAFFGHLFLEQKTSSKVLKWKEISENIVFFKFRLFRAFLDRKIVFEKLAKSKANPLPKCLIFAKNGIFLATFFSTKKRPQIP